MSLSAQGVIARCAGEEVGDILPLVEGIRLVCRPLPDFVLKVGHHWGSPWCISQTCEGQLLLGFHHTNMWFPALSFVLCLWLHHLSENETNKQTKNQKNVKICRSALDEKIEATFMSVQ